MITKNIDLEFWWKKLTTTATENSELKDEICYILPVQFRLKYTNLKLDYGCYVTKISKYLELMSSVERV